jgi:predicted phage baseplate assembly protein
MPLPKPSLDNRSFDQLVAEGRGQIPRLAPAWTDHNASDPGITLIELAAWLSEQNIYRFDRLSEPAVRAFMRLAGVELKPAGVARSVVSLINADAAGVDLPARMQLHTASGPAFETTDPLFASPAQLTALGWRHGSGTLVDLLADDAAGRPYLPFGPRPRPGDACYLGFDRALDAPGQILSLHAWTPSWVADDAQRAALIAEEERHADHLKHHCPPEWARRSGDWRRHYRVRTAWEYYVGAGHWKPLAELADATRAFSLSGFVRFAAPSGHQPGALGSTAFFIRCRIVRGRYECPPRLLRIGFNAVAAEHALSQAERPVGTARGHAGALFRLNATPVVADSVALRLVQGGDVQTDWEIRPDWDRSGAHDRHVLLAPEAGELHAGNGLRGSPLPAGYAIHAAWRAGGGAEGNLAARSLTALPASPTNLALAPALAGLAAPLAVLQPFAAYGGCTRESLAAGQARAYAAATAVDKAVTLADFERLALQTPGLPLARTHAVTGHAPGLPCYPAPGIVTVYVVPHCRLPAPLPTRALCEAVRRYLEPRRLVTSEVHVLPPRYRSVAVHATLHLDCEAERNGTASGVVAAANAALGAFFDPLTGGPDGAGWPLGRSVYRSEVMALLATLPGVLRVTGFGLRTLADAAPRCDNVALCPDQLVRPGRHRLLIQTEMPRTLRRSDPHECPQEC